MNVFIVVLISFLILAGCVPKLGGDGKNNATETFVAGAVVKGFPDVPAYPGAKTIESYGKDKNFGATFYTDDKLAKVIEYYNSAFFKLGWESTLVKNSDTNFQYNIKKSSNQGVVIINTAADGKNTVITISVEPR